MQFIILAIAFVCFSLAGHSQDLPMLRSLKGKEEKLFNSLNEKTEATSQRLDKANRKYISKLIKQEQKLKQRVVKVDSLLAKDLFSGVEEKYKAFNNFSGKANRITTHYSGHLDSLATTLDFLKQSKSTFSTDKINTSLGSYRLLQDKLNSAHQLKEFIAERKRLLQERLQFLKMPGALKAYKKQAYYYSAQIKEYKKIFEEPSKWEGKLMELVLQQPSFQNFFQQNSLLGSLFSSSTASANTAGVPLQGLQTRASVQQVMQTRFGPGPNTTQALQQNVQAAQAQLSSLKNKTASLGQGSFGSGGELDMPEGFKPNSQRTKTFLQRLELGANIQSRGSTAFLPVTTDLGISVGYKLSDKSSIGVGMAYTVGWGKGWNNIRVRSEGMGVRSFLDWKLKGSLYLSGGYELNYRPMVPERISISLAGGESTWFRSGLIGLSKRYKISSKIKGDIRLLWDFLSYTQTPKTQPVVFRVGYALK
jgi:hypothetical protein